MRLSSIIDAVAIIVSAAAKDNGDKTARQSDDGSSIRRIRTTDLIIRMMTIMR